VQAVSLDFSMWQAIRLRRKIAVFLLFIAQWVAQLLEVSKDFSQRTWTKNCFLCSSGLSDVSNGHTHTQTHKLIYSKEFKYIKLKKCFVKKVQTKARAGRENKLPSVLKFWSTDHFRWLEWKRRSWLLVVECVLCVCEEPLRCWAAGTPCTTVSLEELSRAVERLMAVFKRKHSHCQAAQWKHFYVVVSGLPRAPFTHKKIYCKHTSTTARTQSRLHFLTVMFTFFPHKSKKREICDIFLLFLAFFRDEISVFSNMYSVKQNSVLFI